MTSWALAAFVAALPVAPQAQQPQTPVPAPLSTSSRIQIGGQIGIRGDGMPDEDTAELRSRIALDMTATISRVWRAHADVYVDGLVANRPQAVTAMVWGAREAWIEAATGRADIRAGYGRVVWGRLDEIQPSDVINPLDLARFLFDGRSAARLAVGFVRGRLFASEKLTVEGVFVPFFRRGTFDELDEDTSPFNRLRGVILPASVALVTPEIDRQEPEVAWRNVSGGARVLGTIGRVDVAAGAYRGFETFGPVTFEPLGIIGPTVVGHLVQTFPRTTMVSADFETVTGNWEIRGETALFVEKTLQGAMGAVDGRSLDAGAGLYRSTGGLTAFGSVLYHRQWADTDPSVDRSDVSLIGSIEHRFGRERHLARVFGLTTPRDHTGFIRGLYEWKVKDDVTLEASAAAYIGQRRTIPDRFESPDFFFAGLKYYW